MIHINLLAVEREKSRQRAALDPAQRVTVLCSLLLVATALGVGWRWWSLRQASVRLDADIRAAQTEAERLRSVLEQVAEFDRRKALLQQRVALIEELRRGQNGPVHLLDEVSRSLPDRLWLTQLVHQNGDLRIEGRTTSLTALSDFVGNLEGSGYFVRPVEILDSQLENRPGQTDPAQADIVRFTVKAQFALPGSAPPAAAPGASPAGVPGAAPAVRQQAYAGRAPAGPPGMAGR
jgi:type IV pilus assembly protein PilN